ncbi:oligosaccharide flippase family protein [Sediminibacterium sp.]|uniref:oligosaccharide flippase family protein n=1 Tax=Sediminibacterium sp. TaxID=1917865 RepID=UPI003F69728F
MQSKASAFFSFLHLSFIQGANVLIQILLIPIISRKVGLTEFGLIMLASSYAALVSIFINYGSNQSGVKDVAIETASPTALSRIFYSTFYVRGILYILSFVVLLLVNQWILPADKGKHLLFANLIILAELLNPFFFFVGIQKLSLYNIVNLISKLLAVVCILFWVQGPTDGVWVNFFLGAAQIPGYLILGIYLIQKFKLHHFQISISQLKQYFKQNSYLTGNNLSVQLQQSIFLFAVSAMGNAALLGAYSLCDKIVWSFRMLIISLFNVVFPRASILQKENPAQWQLVQQKLRWGIGILFSFVAFGLFFLAHWLVPLITGHEDPMAVLFIQSICLVPLLAAINSLNFAELLMGNQYASIFTISLILLGISVVLSGVFIQLGQPVWFGLFPFFAELGSIPLYRYYIRKSKP